MELLNNNIESKPKSTNVMSYFIFLPFQSNFGSCIILYIDEVS